jgi:leucyl-tRNA synthetase
MVCHETYKDENNKWLSPEEVSSDNGKEFYLKNNPKSKVKVGPSESMSKSKKNTIDPQNIISKYGADAVRLFILADSPPERDIQWSDDGMISSYKFLQKFWLLSDEIFKLVNEKTENESEELNKFTSQIINKINMALEKFRYNVIIASYHEIYSFYKKIIENKKNYKNLKINFEKIFIIMMPVIPHFASECLERLGHSKTVLWPDVNEKHLVNENIEIVIQVNGKKRNIILRKW